MNLVLWIVQWVLAFAMLASGVMKLFMPHQRLAATMKWAQDWPPNRVKLLGLAEAVGAVGLVVPWLTGIVSVLTPIAAMCLAVLMAGAAKTHHDRSESVVAPTVLLLLCLAVAGGRIAML